MQMSCILPIGPGFMQACMRLSFDSLRGRFGGSTAVPCFVVTTVLGSSAEAARELVRAMLSTGAQSLSWQHSFGYQSCACAGAKMAQATTKPSKTITARFRRSKWIMGFRSTSYALVRECAARPGVPARLFRRIFEELRCPPDTL